MESNMKKIEKKDFEFVQKNDKIYDEKFETKNIGFFKDAMIRFAKNKASIVAFVIICLIVLFAIVSPIVSNYDAKFSDTYLTYVSPKSKMFSWLGFDGDITLESQTAKALEAYQNDYPLDAVVEYKTVNDQGSTRYDITLDTYYYRAGYVVLSLTESEYNDLESYCLTNELISDDEASSNEFDSSTWERTHDEIIVPFAESDNTVGGNVDVDEYETDDSGEYVLYDETAGGQYRVRVNYYNYFTYEYGSEPYFLFGTNDIGQDLFSRIGLALRFSLILSVVVASINIGLGVLVGSVEGYYGGAVDLIIERINELVASIPLLVVCSLLVFYVGTGTTRNKIIVLLIVFFFGGWTGASGTVRSQFYRYKGHEYVLAARTLGASDKRIIFRHILPNGIGPIITQAVLMVPSVVFTEASLSYLGIVNFKTGSVASLGSLLNNGQDCMLTAPYVLLYPAILISVLMISFNIFGNGLRDAFNPQLRGAE